MGNELQEKLREYTAHVKAEEAETGVLSMQLGKFLVFIGEDASLVRVLKACNQSIIAPTIIELKLVVCPTLPFKDAGGWKINIQIFSDKLTVSHKKRQTQLNSKPEEQFEFEWETTMIFSKDMQTLEDITFHIIDLKFGNETTKEKQEELTELFKNYMHKSIII